MVKKKKSQDNANKIVLIAAIIIVFLTICSSVYFLGKSNGYQKRTTELENKELELGREQSRLSTWEGNLKGRENNLSQTLFNMTECQDNSKQLDNCNAKLDIPSKFDFIIPLYYSHTEIQFMIISITLIFPITLALFQFAIKDKEIKIVINWILIIILLFILVVMGIN